jgi:hypothetical protein
VAVLGHSDVVKADGMDLMSALGIFKLLRPRTDALLDKIISERMIVCKGQFIRPTNL